MGSKTGWIIAAGLVVAVVGIITKAIFFPAPTSPTSVTLQSEFMSKVETTLPVTMVIGDAPSDGGNAGDDYRAALEVFEANRDALETFLDKEGLKTDLAKGRLTPPVDVLSALEKIGAHVAAGARKMNFEYSLTHTKKKDFDVGYYYQGAYDMGKVSECASILAIYQFGLKQYDQAARTEKDLVVMGWHMTNERVRLHMTLFGFLVQLEAIRGLRTVYIYSRGEHEDQIKAINAYKGALIVAKGAYDDKLPVFQAKSIEPGDILNIAENHEDRAVRIQGILFLGRLRHEVGGSRGDMRATYKLLDHYRAEGDLYEAAAAKAAREMTKEQWDDLSTRRRRMDP